MRTVFVAPSFHNVYGGVQASARTAWEGMVAHSSALEPKLLEYRSNSRWSHLGLLRNVLAARGQQATTLFWHVHLTPLLPLLGRASASAAVFLHGKEAWNPLSPRLQRSVARANLLLTPSQYTWDRFSSANPGFSSFRHTVIPLGLGEVSQVLSVPLDEAPAALMLGRLDPHEQYKGHAEVIQCWPLVQERIPDARLWIAGDGDDTHRLKTLVSELRLGGSVHFWGSITEPAKQALLQRCRCLALPSRAEGFGLVYLEAMRIGRPCLVSGLDAASEVVNPPEAGLAANPSDIPALAHSLTRLLGSGPEWQQWSANAHRRYCSLFTAQHFQNRLIEALSTL